MANKTIFYEIEDGMGTDTIKILDRGYCSSRDMNPLMKKVLSSCVKDSVYNTETGIETPAERGQRILKMYGGN